MLFAILWRVFDLRKRIDIRSDSASNMHGKSAAAKSGSSAGIFATGDGAGLQFSHIGSGCS